MSDTSIHDASALHQALIDRLKQNIPESILTPQIEEALETDYTPSENEIVVERQYTRFVIEIGS
jgi:hypothetical protein